MSAKINMVEGIRCYGATAGMRVAVVRAPQRAAAWWMFCLMSTLTMAETSPQFGLERTFLLPENGEFAAHTMASAYSERYAYTCMAQKWHLLPRGHR